MKAEWIAIGSIPIEGKEFILQDQKLWQEIFKQYSLECNITEPVSANVRILVQEDGVLFQGRVQGSLTMPCHRCGAASNLSVNSTFDSFEEFPNDPFEKGKEAPSLPDYDETVIRRVPHSSGIEVNPFALAWQEFSLALPLKPLCQENCQGLCPTCGCNKNLETCSCVTEEGDPRLSKLRGLTISKK